MTTFVEPQFVFHGIDQTNTSCMGNLDGVRPIKLFKRKSQNQLPLSPPKDYIYQNQNQSNDYDDFYNNLNLVLPSTHLGLQNNMDTSNQMNTFLSLPDLPWIPACEGNGAISHPSTDLISESGAITWAQLCASPKQSSDTDICPNFPNTSQFPTFPQPSFSSSDSMASNFASDEGTQFYDQDSPKNASRMPFTINSLPTGSGQSLSSSGSGSSKNAKKKTSRGNNNTSSTSTSIPRDSQQLRLLRNRQAAAKCRQKKKEYVKHTRTMIESLNSENNQLWECALKLREEIVDIKLLLANVNH